MHVLVEYITKQNLPESLIHLDDPINSDMLIETFERTLTEESIRILEKLNAGICLVRDVYPQPTKVIQHENDLTLVISIGHWLQILDKYPSKGRILLEAILHHESIIISLCLQGTLVLDTKIEDLAIWAGNQYSILFSEKYYIKQPWTREAYIEEANYLVSRRLFSMFGDAWEYIVKERV